jgi:peptidoglycan/xylan/chitin deacetylase (PgdA/CDA1 family)
MASYHVHRSEHARSGVIRTFATVVAAGLLWAGGLFATASVSVNVDGTVRTVPVGTTYGDLVSGGLVRAPRGDVLSVSGAVASARQGALPTIEVDGDMGAASTRVTDGSTVTSRRGRHVLESVVTTIAASKVPVVHVGEGPVVTIEALGAPGLVVARMGAVSHEIATSTAITTGTPMVLRHSPPPLGAKLIALTFDDGPWPGQTQRVLDLLGRERVPATFFVLGMCVQRYPSLAKRIVDEGHTVGNHTQTHVILGGASPQVIKYQMTTGETVIKRYTGVEPTWFRAPAGSVSPAVQAEAKLLGERIAGWAVDTTDWRKPPAYQIVKRVLAGAKPGAIVLMHDGGGDRKQTIDALPAIILELRKQGYTFVTLDQMYGPR